MLKGKRDLLIELRACGQQTIAPGSHADTHPSGNLYEHVDGPDLIDTPHITNDERQVLVSVAMAFDRLSVEDGEIEAGMPGLVATHTGGLDDNDRKRAKQIAKYPWFEKKRPWQSEIQRMLKNDFKLEVESLISKDISYVTEVYVPERLEAKDWLD